MVWQSVTKINWQSHISTCCSRFILVHLFSEIIVTDIRFKKIIDGCAYYTSIIMQAGLNRAQHSDVSEARGKWGKYYFINTRWRRPVHHVFLMVLSSDHKRIWNNYVEIQWKNMQVIFWWTWAYNSLGEPIREHDVWRKTHNNNNIIKLYFTLVLKTINISYKA